MDVDIYSCLRDRCAEYGIFLSDTMLEQLGEYQALLLRWNERVNLTAITDPHEIAVKHFLDSLLLLHAFPPAHNASVIDVGTGAGFPGLPIKIARPDLRLTLLDSLQKRVHFLETVVDSLGICADIVQKRAEEAGRIPALREHFDLVTARAVAPMASLCEYCLPFVRVGGRFAALKGSHASIELEQAMRAIELLGGCLEEVKSYALPGNLTRTIIIIEKVAQISPKYPRIFSKIKKSPLIG